MPATPAPPRSRRATLAPLAAALLSELRKVRKDPADSESVHDARVSARRLIAAGDLWLPDSGRWCRLRDRLDKVIRKLGSVRNLDVIQSLLKKRGPASEATVRRQLSAVAKRDRKKERRRLGKWLTDVRVRRLKKHLLEILDRRSAGLDGAPGPLNLGPRLGAIIRHSAGNPMRDRRTAHELRREVRLLRYAHETLASEYPVADFEAAANLFHDLQDDAGCWHDLWMLDRLADRATRKSLIRCPSAAYRRRVKKEMGEAARKFTSRLKRLTEMKPLLLGETR